MLRLLIKDDKECKSFVGINVMNQLNLDNISKNNYQINIIDGKRVLDILNLENIVK